MKIMSDPVKSSEIEDVLSSIRRLVSEEARQKMQARRAEAEKAVPPEARAPQEPEALVLTPALRVHDGGRAEPDSPAPEAIEEAPFEEAVDEGAEAAPEVFADHVAEPAAEAVQEAVAESVSADDLPEAPAEPETLEAKIAALEALIAGSNEGAAAQSEAPAAEPDAPEAETTDTTDMAPDPAPEAATEEALDWEDHDPDVPEAEAAPDAAEEAPQDTPAEPQDTLAAQEEAQQDDTSEALDQDDDQPPAKPFVFVSRNSVPGPEAAPEAEAGDDGDTDASEELVSAAADLGAIDEEALRDMVVEIVREELQGALGERITRNVRRLVRREIHRALASQELD